ncbi:TetR/AcrR family transcriptional regulator [Echinicola strongylocentroti]|uniref:TetR/AcrR family transcriptional regulator n=1 Tax=Echinicola strongylocentroti TaxID=1795355 RepID=A0A2Z4IN14_9BACT|nr:TetR family transcriptional regulator C-terminal domain-containing protein [Echinicola strongylocentroti]AWW31986.1 TetR/AcrR family transcriptional regulator [Echinicola strongylocentroti]
MEKTTAKKPTKIDKRAKIIDAYKTYVLEHGKSPASVFKFTKELKMKEVDFYAFFSSFTAVKRAVWQNIFQVTLTALESQKIYKEYSSREKLLAFFYTWIEELKHNRSYLLVLYGAHQLPSHSLPQELKGFRNDFKEYASGVLAEGEENEEIAKRPYLSDKYDEALWLQVLFVFRFWVKDQSDGFEKTDEAIEKSVNLAFDLMGKSALDTFVDFAKFLYQSR